MSGGSHNYVCYSIEENLCGQMKDTELNDLIKDIANLAHELEWYESGDTNKDGYIEAVKAFKDKWFKSDRNERLKKYIDEETERLRKDLREML